MQPMTTTPPQVDETEETDKRSIPPVWIPATLCVGLLIAAIYLGGRIVSARQTSTVAKTAAPQAQTLPPPPPPVVQPVLAESVKQEVQPELLTGLTKSSVPKISVTKGPATIALINPNAGELYLQLGAMNEEATHRFVQDLRSKNLEPKIVAGPTPGIVRVLIGPFDNRAALDERMAQLRTQGLNPFPRRY
jgi:cell division septation protein DedD